SAAGGRGVDDAGRARAGPPTGRERRRMSITAAGRVVRLEEVADRPLLADLAGARDPQAGYAALRSRWGAVAPVDLEPGVPAWLALGYEEVGTVLRNEVLFSRDSRAWRYE